MATPGAPQCGGSEREERKGAAVLAADHRQRWDRVCPSRPRAPVAAEARTQAVEHLPAIWALRPWSSASLVERHLTSGYSLGLPVGPSPLSRPSRSSLSAPDRRFFFSRASGVFRIRFNLHKLLPLLTSDLGSLLVKVKSIFRKQVLTTKLLFLPDTISCLISWPFLF